MAGAGVNDDPPTPAPRLRRLSSSADFGGSQHELSPNALPKERWLHDKLSRQSAESLLADPGSFLVRQSSSSEADFVLSYRPRGNYSSQFAHFKITVLCGRYILGSRRFASLDHVVDYFMHEAHLVPDEFLGTPVPPKQPVKKKEQVISMFNYTKVVDTHELSLKAGEVLEVESVTETGWYWLVSTASKQSGLVHSCLVQPYNSSIESVKQRELFAACSRDQCNRILKDSSCGCFLLREGTRRAAGDAYVFTLCVRTVDNIHRFRVEVRPRPNEASGGGGDTQAATAEGYWLGGRFFHTIDHLIDHYRREEILDGVHLTRPAAIPKGARYRPVGRRGEGEREAAESGEADLPPAAISKSSASDLVGSQESILHTGWLERRGARGGGKWKRCYFVLNGREQRLYCFDDNTRRRPKDMVDMSISTVYPLHSSFSERQFSFQVVSRISHEDKPVMTCLVANTAQSKQDWMMYLASVQSLQLVSSIEQLLKEKSVEAALESRRRNCTNLYWEIHEVADLQVSSSANPPGSGLYLLMQLDDVPYAKTCNLHSLKHHATFEKFAFKKLPREMRHMKIYLMAKHKRSRDSEMGLLTVELSELPVNQWNHLKLPLVAIGQQKSSTSNLSSSSSSSSGSVGHVKMDLLAKKLCILPLPSYEKLKTMLLEDIEGAADLLHRIGTCIPTEDIRFLASLLLKTYLFHNCELAFIRALNQREILTEETQISLFRSSSLATSVMEEYLRLVMTQFVRETMQPIIDEIAIACCDDSPLHCTATPSAADASTKVEHFLRLLGEQILGHVDKFPSNLRFLLQCMKEDISRKWPSPPNHPPSIKYRVIGSFVFLRCLSLALVSPRLYHLQLGSGYNVAAVQDMLKMLAKLLQAWANTSSIKDHPGIDASALNGYLKQHQERMEFFLEGLSTSPTGPVECKYTEYCDIEEKLAAIHRICADNMRTIRKNSIEQPILKKVIIVVDELNRECGLDSTVT